MDNASPPDGLPPVLGSMQPAPGTPRRRRWLVHLFLIGSYPLAVGLLGWGRTQSAQPALGHGPRGLLLVVGVELLVFGVIFGLAWLASRATREELLLRWRNSFWPVPLGIAYSVALRIAVGLVVAFAASLLLAARVMSPDALQRYMLENRPDVGAVIDVSALRQNPLYFWLSVTLVSFLVGGFREELWRSAFLAATRAVWPSPLATTPGQILAAGVAAVIFGLGHLAQGPLAVCLTGLLGFGLGVIMVLHRSIWPAVFAHGMFDATSMALLPWVMEKLPEAVKTI